ncbi:MAG TPA: type II CAAX endopeptidase family protein [Pyrinomonadaceae bacterium]
MNRQNHHHSPAPFVIYLILFHATWTIWVLWGYPRLRTLNEQTLLYASINLTVRALIWVLPVFLYLHYVDGVKPSRYLKLRQHWLRGLLVALAFSSLNLLVSLVQHGFQHFRTGAITWNSILSTSLLIGFVEEVPYRGFIFQKLNEWWSFPVASLISSLLFLAIHLPGWFSLHLFTIHNAIFVFAFGVLMTLLLRYARSLWAPVVSHSLNDFFSVVLFHR